MEEREIINRVANSALVTFDLEELYQPGERVLLDIKDQLYQGLILREKDFRDFIKNHNWSQYKDKFVAVTCSTDAIIPAWAYMLVAVAVKPFARAVRMGTLENMEEFLFEEKLKEIDWSRYQDSKVVVKGCSKVAVPFSAYTSVAAHLQPFAASIMFGEACSTVPLYKAKK